MSVWSRFQRLLHTVYHRPSMIKGSGLPYEVAFERLLRVYGILPCPDTGYERHPNGPQRWPDFHIMDRRTCVPVELKTTSRMTVAMGKTWIQSDALYLIHHRPLDTLVVAWGKDMKTEEDDRRFREFQHHVRCMNRGRSFVPLVQWTANTHVHYRLEMNRRDMLYEKVMEELRRIARQ